MFPVFANMPEKRTALKNKYKDFELDGQYLVVYMCDAKPIVRKSLIDRGLALPYFEPDSTVMSRSGEECMVALTDQ